MEGAFADIRFYGVTAYAIQRRTREIGIRLAMGAQPHQVRNMVLAQGMTLTLLGVALGTASALGVTRVLASLLFGVTPHDPLVFVAVPVLLVAVALVAVWLPARRATHLNPVAALRAE